MAKLNIGFDIDGVALKYTERFVEVFKLFGGTSDVGNTKEFSFFSAVREDEHRALYMTFAYMMNETLSLHSDFEVIIKFMLKEKQQPLQFITARQPDLSCESARTSLENVLSYWNVAPSLLKSILKIDCVGKNGVHGSKVPKIKEHNMEYFIEDRRKNVLEISQAGVTVFMPRRSWNKLSEYTPNVIQYDNCSEVVKYLRCLQ